MLLSKFKFFLIQFLKRRHTLQVEFRHWNFQMDYILCNKFLIWFEKIWWKFFFLLDLFIKEGFH